jgi:hypothetical protein
MWNHSICNGKRLQQLNEYIDSWFWKAFLWAPEWFKKIEININKQQKLTADSIKYNGIIWLIASFVTDPGNQPTKRESKCK